MIKVYIAGTINGLMPNEVITRFNWIESKLMSKGFETRNPIRGKKINTMDKGFIPYEPREIVDRDLWDIENSDIVIAIAPHPSIGTSMEIIYARMVKKIPVIVVTENPSVYNHYWIKGLASKILPSVEDAISYIEEWYG